MRILLGGASGFIGKALALSLEGDGHEVVALGRPSSPRSVAIIDVSTRSLDLTKAGGDIGSFDVVFQVLGAPLVPWRWSPVRREAIRASRITTTDIIARAIAESDDKPDLVIGAAVGYYGSRGDEILTESSGPGDGMLADLCRAWELAGTPAADSGARVVVARTGVVLGQAGGMLLPQLPLFRLGLGARLGTGLQWMSWISLTDHVRALRFLAEHHELTGPVNLVAPRAVTNTEFTEELAHALGRRAPLTVPRAALLAIAGQETTDEFLLASQRAVPRVLEGAGFSFDFPDIAAAIRVVTASDGLLRKTSGSPDALRATRS
ncbi:MAG TPA: TIGR01777 family oxidoreductase [Acidimicrobiales bacterium]